MTIGHLNRRLHDDWMGIPNDGGGSRQWASCAVFYFAGQSQLPLVKGTAAVYDCVPAVSLPRLPHRQRRPPTYEREVALLQDSHIPSSVPTSHIIK
jgi:hypothetical protein